ncbi:MAG TPA: iron ABC transporter permease, partial [Blastocatellia bacterium]|nr:iron ABC transporter permease [Blastocatellia bacterium]
MALAILTAALLLIFVIAISIGSEHVSLSDIGRIIVAKIGGRSASVLAEHQTIIADIRLPRVLMAIVVGAALSVAGAAYQALLRNPLADPYILGISTGSALGAIIATVYAEAIPVGRPIAAFIGASLAIATVYVLGQTREGASSERLILAGVITNAFLSSLVIFLLTAVSGSNLRSVFSWLIGDLSGGARLLPVVAAFSVAGIAVIYANARSLNLLMMGEEDAAALGVEVKRL